MWSVEVWQHFPPKFENWFDNLVTPFPGFPCGSAGMKNPLTMRETWVRFLGWEDPLEKAATHSSILGLRIPWTV